MSAKANTVFNIMPMTFILPKEYVGFLENFSEFEDFIKRNDCYKKHK
jgi:hypothetical protein